jgi:hypothetical protein
MSEVIFSQSNAAAESVQIFQKFMIFQEVSNHFKSSGRSIKGDDHQVDSR